MAFTQSAKEPPNDSKDWGLDLAKDFFQVHCMSATGHRIINKKIKRAKLLAFFETLPRCVIGMEAYGSAHYWGRELRKLGHDVRVMPAAYVKPYVKRGAKQMQQMRRRSARRCAARPRASLRSNPKISKQCWQSIAHEIWLSGSVLRS